MCFRKQSLLYLVILLCVATQTVVASVAYQYRAPDGSIVFTGEPLELPFQLVKKMTLNWGDVRARKIKKQIVEPKKADVAAKSKNQPKFAAIVDEKSKKYKVIPELLHAVIEAESAYDPDAVSRAGAVGLMQLMPATAKRFGVTDRTNPSQNVDGGAHYLRVLLDYFDNDLTLAIASYNAGEGAVVKYGRKIPPYRETQNYVVKVKKFLRRNLKQNRAQSLSATVAQTDKQGS
ncbi:MAG: lytic transglycosylase domain-containing protein, partial [Gammaproteobacteria bacterium]|nr:lytic transglycosylase domain-containing protein [Gammaproteobacteria bacterium]